ncbi:ABC transporter permease subunit [Acetivibrio mesophilus]|uniref:ABC transporter permease n=1 Tax=Acetivibrio mesophilus TaxID=2487273 RepID=A0A4Q0I0K7_9FIRM|nr:ABC transporter permease subunit [Acetivibrio mesophilus]ODM27860.1 ABC transporter permease [Clostridium sp. Bc-iso-3]RXE57740.1 ABC transporter permease [Acetivibrio mesophilus]
MKAVQKAIIYKDIKEIISNKQTLVPMIVVPLIIMVVLPAGLMVAAAYGEGTLNGMDEIIKIIKDTFIYENESQLIVELAVNYMFPNLFLLIPIMASSIIAASSFVGEKERKTMESLLYTPMSIKQLFTAKVIGTAIPAYIISLMCFVVFGIIVNIGGWFYFGRLIFPNLKWIILVLWVTPAVTILAIAIMVIVSAKAETFQDAQQMSGFIVVPVILLFVGQVSGLFMLNTLILLAAGAVLYVADYILIKVASGKFMPEKLV